MAGIDEVGVRDVVELDELVYRNSISLGDAPKGISWLNRICFLNRSGAGDLENLVYIN